MPRTAAAAQPQAAAPSPFSAVVAPVHDQNGAVAAAMGITVQQPSLDPALREQLVATVERLLSGSGNTKSR